jgi:diguanylate cyclase (GGDEF)-like protein
MSGLRRAAAWLPRGGLLPRAVLVARHRGVLVVLWLHVPLVVAVALHHTGLHWHLLLEVLPVVGLAVMAQGLPHERLGSRLCAGLGLLTCSALGVHLTGGLIEAHFHFFVVVAVLTLYQDWTLFALAIGFVAIHHAVMSTLMPGSVYDHPSALAHPLWFAMLHAVFVLAAAAANVVSWRSGERGAYDQLTGLPVASLLVHQLEQVLRSGPAVVVYVDLDGFKQVNDTLGHRAGDELLAAVSRRMEEVARRGDRLGRMGGDEFAVVLGAASVEDGAELAGRLVDAVSLPFVLRSGTVHIGLSAGVCHAVRGSDAEQLLAAADAQMYAAKQSGRGRYVLAPEGLLVRECKATVAG